MSKRIAWALTRYLLAFALLGWVVGMAWAPAGGDGIKSLWEAHVIRGVPLRYDMLAAATGAGLAAVHLTFVRWYLLLRLQRIALRLPAVLGLGAIGMFFGTFLPGSVGGDVMRVIYLGRIPGGRAAAAASVLADRIVGLWSLLALTAVAGAVADWSADRPQAEADTVRFITASATVAAVAGVVGWIGVGLVPARAERLVGGLSRWPRVASGAAVFCHAVLLYRHRPGGVLAGVAISVLGHLCAVGAFYWGAMTIVPAGDVARSVPPLGEHLLIVPVGLVVRAVPLFPGGLGIGELGFAELYRGLGYPPATGAAASLLYRAIAWVIALEGYVVYVITGGRSPALWRQDGARA